MPDNLNKDKKFKTNKFDDIDLIKYEVDNFKNSLKLEWMLLGKRYYENENDILNKVSYRYISNEENEASRKAIDLDSDDKKISNAFMKLIVDTKVGYVLSKPPTIKSEDDNYSSILNEIFNYKNHRALKNVGKEAMNKGIGWIHLIIEENKLLFKVIPSEEVVPIWNDGEHGKLNAVIRFYNVTEISKISGSYEEKQVPKYEYWDCEKVQYFTENDNGDIVIDSEKYLVNGGLEYFHITKNETVNGKVNILGKGWGRVPFIAFKKDSEEMPEIKYVKGLVDDYDEKISDNSTHVQELPDSIIALTGVGGTDPTKLRDNLKKFSLILLDDDESKIESINRNLIVEAFKTHVDILEKNIYLFSRSVNKNNDKFGNNPSGISLQFLYQDMENDCNNFELEFKASFENLKYFIDTWLKQMNMGDFFETEANIIFNRTLLVNESELIDNLKNSVGIISNETIMENHPYVDDASKEKDRIESERKKAQDEFNSYNGTFNDDRAENSKNVNKANNGNEK